MIVYNNMSIRKATPLEVSVYTVKTGQKISSKLENELDRQLSLSGWLALDYLLRNGESPLSELVPLLGSKANATEITSKLEGRGLIIKETNPNNRRTRYVRITASGELAVEQNEPRLHEASAVLLGGLDDREQAETSRVMSTILGEKVISLLDRSPPDPVTS